MNNGSQELTTATRGARSTKSPDDLDTLKRELMKAEVRLAKARATVVTAEIEIKVLSAQLKAAAK
jgi:hypothetical protein